MNKKIITLIGAAALLASSTHANPHVDSTLRDGIVGAILGGIIGNNTGSGDGDTGALIGAVAGVTNGIMNRRGHYGHSRGIHYGHGHHIPVRPVYTTVYEQVWVQPIYNYDAYGNPFVVRAGYYKTITRRVRVR
jgi:hypothetical protein